MTFLVLKPHWQTLLPMSELLGAIICIREVLACQVSIHFLVMCWKICSTLLPSFGEPEHSLAICGLPVFSFNHVYFCVKFALINVNPNDLILSVFPKITGRLNFEHHLDWGQGGQDIVQPKTNKQKKMKLLSSRR